MCFSIYWILIYISTLLAVSLEPSLNQTWRTGNWCMFYAKCIPDVCVTRLPFRESNPFAPAHCPVGNLNVLCKHWTKNLRIQENKSNPKFTFRVVYLKDPITNTQRGHNTTQLHHRRNTEFLKLWPQKRWFPLNILVQDGESQSSGCCQDLGFNLHNQLGEH